MTATSDMTVPQMKDYIRKHKLNKPHLRLGMKRAEMIAGFKKEGRWKEVPKVKKTTKAPVKKAVKKPKLPPRPKATASVKKAPVKKPRKKTYYVGYDMLDDETYDLFGGDYKPEESYGIFSLFSIKSTREPDDPFWENAPYRSNKKFDYDDRMDNKV